MLCTRLLHFLFHIFKPVCKQCNRRRGDSYKPDEKTVRTFDTSLQWHQILLSCFSLRSSASPASMKPTSARPPPWTFPLFSSRYVRGGGARTVYGKIFGGRTNIGGQKESSLFRPLVRVMERHNGLLLHVLLLLTPIGHSVELHSVSFSIPPSHTV